MEARQGDLSAFVRTAFCFEYPVLPEWFLTKNKPLIIRVDDNVAAEQVKSKVRNCYVEKCSPWYVVEKSGRLHGFVLWGDLIIAGVTLIEVFPHYLPEMVERLGVQLLTRAGFRLVEKNLPALIVKMREAAVSGLEKVYFWMLALKRDKPEILTNVMIWKGQIAFIILSMMILRSC